MSGLCAVVVGIEVWAPWCEVQCDVCRTVYTTQTQRFPKSEERAQLAADLREAGWLVEGDHERHSCPDCCALTS